MLVTIWEMIRVLGAIIVLLVAAVVATGLFAVLLIVLQAVITNIFGGKRR